MSIQLEIPDSVVQAMRLPLADQRRQLLTELALALYAQGALSLGKASELAELDRYEFGLLLGRRGIPRHYTSSDLEDDLDYARG